MQPTAAKIIEEGERMQDLRIDILTPHHLLSHDDARTVLDLICNIYPDLAPEKYDWLEPIRKRFDPRQLDHIISQWNDIFLWKRTHPRLEGGVFAGTSYRPIHALLSIDMDAEQANVNGLTRFLCQAAERLEADFAFIHLLTQPEIDRGGPGSTISLSNPDTNSYSLSVTTHHLIKWLPDLYWATVFGKPYVDLFGRENLLAAPAPVVRELEGGGMYLQLSESPLDLEHDFARVDAIRARVKTHLNHNAFYDANLPGNHRYNVPQFHLTPAPPRDFAESDISAQKREDESLTFDFGDNV